jgi:hypothetical protein
MSMSVEAQCVDQPVESHGWQMTAACLVMTKPEALVELTQANCSQHDGKIQITAPGTGAERDHAGRGLLRLRRLDFLPIFAALPP